MRGLRNALVEINKEANLLPQTKRFINTASVPGVRSGIRKMRDACGMALR